MTPGESRPSACPAPPQAERAGGAPLRGRAGSSAGMDVAVDLYLAVPLLFTVLALVLASVFVKLRGGEGRRAAAAEPREEAAAAAAAEAAPQGGPGDEAAPAARAAAPEDEGGRVPVEEVGAEPRQPGRQEDADGKEEDPDSENEKLVVKEPEDEDAADETFSFKYSPGKLRGNQYKSMMTKEELEEEQRVQREQLAAIFRLMKEKSDTFGEMSEGDMKEQLRLYDI
ncbi:matrix-remodeling-associated protein 7 isoform X3 [Dromaius novaehollandiae]|uniref:matrix-remodeling-associated protein 7 isoform X3 n=1 Tax=Dromaius novaehollandiae TaxID=8790 RepID=UPI00311DF1A3